MGGAQPGDQRQRRQRFADTRRMEPDQRADRAGAASLTEALRPALGMLAPAAAARRDMARDQWRREGRKRTVERDHRAAGGGAVGQAERAWTAPARKLR